VGLALTPYRYVTKNRDRVSVTENRALRNTTRRNILRRVCLYYGYKNMNNMMMSPSFSLTPAHVANGWLVRITIREYIGGDLYGEFSVTMSLWLWRLILRVSCIFTHQIAKPLDCVVLLYRNTTNKHVQCAYNWNTALFVLSIKIIQRLHLISVGIFVRRRYIRLLHKIRFVQRKRIFFYICPFLTRRPS